MTVIRVESRMVSEHRKLVVLGEDGEGNAVPSKIEL